MPAKFGLQQPAFRERSGHSIWQNTERIAIEAETLGFDSYKCFSKMEPARGLVERPKSDNPLWLLGGS